MKKFVVFCWVSICIVSFQFAQSIILTTPTTTSPELISPAPNTVVNNDTVTYCSENMLVTFEDGKILFINNTAAPMDVLVRRYADENVCFTSNQFCWTICHNPNVSLSDPMTIPAYDSTNAFHGWMTPDGNDGCCYIKYRFYNEDDTTVFAETTIKYCFSHDCSADNLSIDENGQLPMNVYPNPADGPFNISFEPLQQPGMIRITDQTGRVAKELLVQSHEQALPVQRDGLSAGIYFCHLYLDGKLMATQKVLLK
jgi:hypothetical protein